MTLVELARGGTAAVLETNGEHVTILANVPSPPGSTLEAALDGQPLHVKVRGCRRVDPDEAGRTYRIEGRFVSLSRALRVALVGH